MTSDDAREELEALIRHAVPASPSANAVVDVILAAADAYRDAPVPFLRADMHLEGIEGGYAACRYGLRPAGRQVTRNPALVMCGKCLRSRLYRDMTAGAREAEAA